MATLSVIFPIGTIPSAVMLTALVGSPAATTALPLNFTGPVTLGDGRDEWTVTFAGPAESYAWQATATIGGTPTPMSGTVAGDATAGAAYATQDDIDVIFGPDLITQWAEAGGVDAVDVPARVAVALAETASRINKELEPAYVVPIVVPAGSDDANMLRRWNARLAGYLLFSVQGQTDKTDRYADEEAAIWAEIGRYRDKELELTLAAPQTDPNQEALPPQGIPATVDRYGRPILPERPLYGWDGANGLVFWSNW